MDQKFFEWLTCFDNVNVKTHEIAACATFDSFKEIQIETLLKKCYVKDLLYILHNKFGSLFDIDGKDTYPILQEMIGRRNVHVHNNGIVDQMYLEKFNLYGATQGEYLKINKEYFDNATTLTMKVVTSISQINN